MNGIEVRSTIINAEDFITLLRAALPAATTSNIIAGALKKAARPMAKRMQAMYRAQGRSGSLAAATRVWRLKRRRNDAIVHVGPLRYQAGAIARYTREYGTPVRDIRHAHLVERGTKVRRTKAGAKRGQMQGKFIVDRSARATVGDVKAAFSAIIRADVAKRLAARSRKKA